LVFCRALEVRQLCGQGGSLFRRHHPGDVRNAAGQWY